MEQLVKTQIPAVLESYNESLHAFLENLERLLQHLRDDLAARQALQRTMNKTVMAEGAAQMFWQDQLHFYSQWLKTIDRQFYDDQDRCALRVTVKELLWLLRLLNDEQLIASHQLKQLFQFISLHMRTEKQELLSYESLRKKYSQLDVEVLRNVKTLLNTLLKRTNHYFALLSNK